MLDSICKGGLPPHLTPQAATASHDAAATAQRDLCVLAQLADKYQVPQIITRVLRLLPHAGLRTHPAWQAVHFLLAPVPDGISTHNDFRLPCMLARAHALRLLSDLEVVLRDREMIQNLLQLPFDVLLELVGGGNSTRVAYESSVVEAISTW